MIRRLRLKFVCINMAIVTLMLCAIFAMVFFFTRANLERESIGMMQALAQEPMRPGGPDERPEGVRLPFFTLELDEDGGIADAWGGYYDLTDGELLEKLLALAEAGDGNTGVLEDYGLRYCRVWARGTQYIVFADMSSERSVIANLIKNSLLIGALSFAAFLVVSLLLARWAVRPVELAWERQRQFVADASHELKTPLTVILSNAQLLGEAEGDPALRSRLRENILSMSARMRSLVESLLDLARVDSGPRGRRSRAWTSAAWSPRRYCPLSRSFTSAGSSSRARSSRASPSRAARSGYPRPWACCSITRRNTPRRAAA